MPIEKRWFFRRAVAFMIDMVIVSLGVMVVALLLEKATGISFETPEIVTFSSCRNVDLVSPETFQAFGKDPAQGEHSQTVCKISNLGIASYYVTTIGTILINENTTQPISVNYASDAEGNPVRLVSLDWILPFLAPVLFAFQLSRKRATFGKRILAVNVVTLESSTPTFKAALRREILKFFPLIMVSIFEIALGIFWLGEYNSGAGTPDQIVRELAPLVPDPGSLMAWIVPSSLLSLVIVIFYFGSFIRWRGQTFWDRFAGLKVINL